mgnify:CR=1 FL=1
MHPSPTAPSPRAARWDNLHRTRVATEMSWYQPLPATSLELIQASELTPQTPIVDVGSGASTLVDALLDRGFQDITLLDIADAAFAPTRARLGARAERITFVASDVTRWTPTRNYGLWHDRAVFHFLTDAGDRAAYKEVLRAALARGATAIVATFALDGPEKCSGLPIVRYSIDTLAAELRGVLRLREHRHELHRTPSGGTQSFVFGAFSRA